MFVIKMNGHDKSRARRVKKALSGLPAAARPADGQHIAVTSADDGFAIAKSQRTQYDFRGNGVCQPKTGKLPDHFSADDSYE
jgi:hypothetical protein